MRVAQRSAVDDDEAQQVRHPISHLLQYSACTAHTNTRTHGRHDLSRLVGGVLLWCRGPLELQCRTNSSSRSRVLPLSPHLRTPPGATPSLLFPPENGGLAVDPQEDANADFFGTFLRCQKMRWKHRSVD